jgi:hypothetical protein
MDATLAELGDVRSVARQIRTREQEREETKAKGEHCRGDVRRREEKATAVLKFAFEAPIRLLRGVPT